MAYLIFGKDELLGAWAAKRIPHIGKPEKFGPFTAIGVATGPTAQDRLMAVIVYSCHMPEQKTIQISAASCDPRWASRATLRDVFSVAFIEYKAFKIWAAIPHKQERVVKFTKAIGFKSEGILRHQFGPKSHAVVCGMITTEYRKKYLPEEKLIRMEA